MRFIYSARNSSGERISSSEEAETADDLIARLQLRGLFVTSIKAQADIPAKSVSHAPQKVKACKFSHSGIKADDLTVFARQLAISLDSGVPLLKSLGSILRQIPSRKFHDVVTKISFDVESGFSFRDSLAKHSRVFSSLWINLIETGEASGNLPTILERLAGYLERRAAFQRKIVSAMVYPIILVAVAMIAVVIFILAVIPKFTEIFSNFDIELPVPTKLLIATSDFLRGNFLLLSVIIVV
ncbi:MAG: type II secretion system F family protein, partial [Candidatus Omnitrophota bacterium]